MPNKIKIFEADSESQPGLLLDLVPTIDFDVLHANYPEGNTLWSVRSPDNRTAVVYLENTRFERNAWVIDLESGQIKFFSDRAEGRHYKVEFDSNDRFRIVHAGMGYRKDCSYKREQGEWKEDGCKAPQTAQYSELDNIVAGLVEETAVSGVVSVTIAGETVYEKAFNNESLRDTFEINSDTAFVIASLTKSFSAVLTLDQVLSGNIELDAPVNAYLPDFDAEYAELVTVRQLLQNRSGIPHYVGVPGWFDPEAKAKFTPESFLAELSKLTLKFEPGTEYLYSNVNYYLLGLILDSTSGQRYEKLLGDTILGPLGLTNTGQIYSDETGTLAPTFLRDGDRYERIDITNPKLFRATGSQYSTAKDLALFADALMTGELLDAATREVLFDRERPMGFSVTSDEFDGSTVDIVTYNGELVGTTTMLTMFPEKRMSIVVLSNNNTPYPTLVKITLALARSIFTSTAHPAP